MNLFSNLITSYRARTRRERDMELDSHFAIVEREGQLWLTCCGVAFMTFPSDMTHSAVVNALKSSRFCAKVFDRHSHIELSPIKAATDSPLKTFVVVDRRDEDEEQED